MKKFILIMLLILITLPIFANNDITVGNVDASEKVTIVARETGTLIVKFDKGSFNLSRQKLVVFKQLIDLGLELVNAAGNVGYKRTYGKMISMDNRKLNFVFFTNGEEKYITILVYPTSLATIPIKLKFEGSSIKQLSDMLDDGIVKFNEMNNEIVKLNNIIYDFYN